MSVDWAAEGLLDGLDGEARAAREELLTALHEQGELGRAAAPGGRGPAARDGPRRARAARRGRPHDARDRGATRGLGLDYALEVRRALALPVPDDPDAPVLIAGRARARAPGPGAARRRHAAGVVHRGLTGDEPGDGRRSRPRSRRWAEWMRRAGDTERDLGLRYAESLRALGPAAGPALENMFMLRLREQVRQAVVDQAQLESGALARRAAGRGRVRRPGRLHPPRRVAPARGARRRRAPLRPTSSRTSSRRRCGW